MTHTTIKVRIYPNNSQKQYLEKLFGSCRFVYNRGLEYKKSKWETEKKSTSKFDLNNCLHRDWLKDPELVWLKDHNTKVIRESLVDLDKAYKGFFNAGKGYPKFKKKGYSASARFSNQAISPGNDYASKHLTLTGQLKNLHFRTSRHYREILTNYTSHIKSATLTKNKAGRYYLSFVLDLPEFAKLPSNSNVVGIDLGVKDFVVTSDGEVIPNLKIIRSNQKKLSKLHKSHSRKQKGSRNREKARIKLAKFHEKLTNTKKHYLHQISNKLLSENQAIVIEDLNVSGMLKNHKLARSISELSISEFTRILEYKSEWYGRTLVKVDRFYPSSKTCSSCKSKQEITLRDRVFSCNSCNFSINRDLNAALNIQQEGVRILSLVPGSTGEFKPVERRAAGALKQEFTQGL